jgi:excisionase family DNA binding protein
MEPAPHFNSAKETASAVGLHERTIKSLARRRVIPSLRIGHRTLRFEIEKVKAALARLEIKEVGRPK